MDSTSVDIPVELWQMIFSWLPFKDLLNCRTICRDWLDLVSTLPAYKSKNCLNLEIINLSENEPPFTVFQHSNLRFDAIKAKKSDFKVSNQTASAVFVDLSPNLTSFLTQIFETVTYLDLSGVNSKENDEFLYFIENLNLFKALHHLNMGSCVNWLSCVYKPWPDYWSLAELITAYGQEICEESGQFDKASVESFFIDDTFAHYPESTQMKRYKNIIKAEVIKNLGDLQEVGQYRNWEMIEIFLDVLVSRISDRLVSEVGASLDISKSSNLSVRVLTISQVDNNNDFETDNEISVADMEKLFKLVPNVQEIHIKAKKYVGTTTFLFPQEHPDKIATFSVCGKEQVEQIKTVTMPNLKHLKINSSEDVLMLEPQDFDGIIENFPKLKSLGLWAMDLPEHHHRYFTELTIDWTFDLNTLSLFENLQSLEALFDNRLTRCFFGHEQVNVGSLRTFKVKFESENFCFNCFDTLLQSLPNLKTLKYIKATEPDFYQADRGKNYITSIFNNFQDRDLAELKIYTDDMLIPSLDWPVMNNLRKFKIRVDKFLGQRENWEKFFQMFVKLDYLTIVGRNWLKLFHVRNVLGNHMPLLKRFEITDRTRVDIEVFARNGRELKVLYKDQDMCYDSEED